MITNSGKKIAVDFSNIQIVHKIRKVSSC